MLESAHSPEVASRPFYRLGCWWQLYTFLLVWLQELGWKRTADHSVVAFYWRNFPFWTFLLVLLGSLHLCTQNQNCELDFPIFPCWKSWRCFSGEIFSRLVGQIQKPAHLARETTIRKLCIGGINIKWFPWKLKKKSILCPVNKAC